MRPDTRHLPANVRRSAAAGMPAALAGSLAVLMSAAPAHAAEPSRSGDSASPRILSALDRSPAVRVPTPSSVRVPASATPETYDVQAGDTVATIAARHGLRTTDVLAINGLTWSSIIYPGQVLRLAAAPADAPPPAPTEPTAPTAGSHLVAGGDTIGSIASQHGLSIEAVLSANGLDWSSIIYPGQSLAIPGASSAPPESAAPAPPAAPPAPPAADSYVVADGDTISAIAQLHAVPVQAVLDANGLTTSSIIHPGQSIEIPMPASVLLAVNATSAAPTPSTALDAEQISNAALIISVGRELGVPDRGIAIALGTAMQESWLMSLDWGDRDSLGLFQQRPSAGWGTPEEVRDPVRAARAFYGGPADPNGALTRGLLDVDGWQDMSFAEAAQAVQISAHPDRYAQWEQPAYAWLAAHG